VSRSRVTAGRVVLVLLASGGFTAAGAFGATGGGSQLANRALLTRAQLGSGWSVNSSRPRSVPPLTCGAFHPGTKGITRAGAAASPTYQQSASGPFVSQVAYAYASATQAQQVWGKVVRPALVRCVASALAQSSGSGVHFKVTGRRLLALPKLAANVAGYRASGTATQSAQSIDVYLDMIVLGRGSVITAVSISSFQQPAGRALELRLARAAARRLPGG
jgi:hypothetical protein